MGRHIMNFATFCLKHLLCPFLSLPLEVIVWRLQDISYCFCLLSLPVEVLTSSFLPLPCLFFKAGVGQSLLQHKCWRMCGPYSVQLVALLCARWMDLNSCMEWTCDKWE